MNIFLSRIIGTGFSVVLIFLSGFWLSRSGKPYPVMVFILHKLIALGVLIFLTVMVTRVHQSTPLHGAQGLAFGVTALCFLALIITGGLLSVEKVMPSFILKIHQTIPYLAVISVGMTLYLLLLWGSRVTSAAR